MNRQTPERIFRGHRLIIRCLAMMLLVGMAFCAVSVSLASGSSYIRCTCIGHCECFIQEGDEGNAVKEIIKLLIKEGWLTKKTSTAEFSSDVTEAVKQFQGKNHLEPTGTMDDDTLTLLIWGMLPEELDAVRPSSRTETVFIPTDGGKKRHKSEKCSGMKDPRKVSIRNAEALGFDACKRKGCAADNGL